MVYGSINGGDPSSNKIKSTDSVIIGENSYYINCNNSGNEKITLVPIPEMTMGVYNPSEDATYCIISGYDDKSLTIIFEGNETGTQTKRYKCQIKTDKTYKAVDLKLKVSKYEDIGGLIEGTFKGTFVNTNYDSGDTCKVTDGKFSVIRQKRGY